MPPRAKKPPAMTEEETRAVATAAGYVSPYPAPGTAPDTMTDRCTDCGWTLFVSMVCAVYCINAKCKQYQHDLTEEVTDEQQPVPAAQ